MAINASISISQGVSADQFIVTDTTNLGSEAITARTLVIYKADGSIYRKPGQTTDALNFSPATYPSNQIVIDGLDKDYAFSVVMTLTPSIVVSGSVYTVTTKFALVGYTMTAFYKRMQKINTNIRNQYSMTFVHDTAMQRLQAIVAVKAAAANNIERAQIALDKAKRINDQTPA